VAITAQVSEWRTFGAVDDRLQGTHLADGQAVLDEGIAGGVSVLNLNCQKRTIQTELRKTVQSRQARLVRSRPAPAARSTSRISRP